ncbi:hypothetical protein QQF64_019903 [Cirrhinus molitorella]|uniref:Uncharacterized protein n=1 Tax=Cirrhinus molitorella TaxID=172907 RepID=A0ABR3LGS1_9TELE
MSAQRMWKCLNNRCSIHPDPGPPAFSIQEKKQYDKASLIFLKHPFCEQRSVVFLLEHLHQHLRSALDEEEK